MCVCLRCGLLAFEAVLAVFFGRMLVGGERKGEQREGAEKHEEKTNKKVGKVVFVGREKSFI